MRYENFLIKNYKTTRPAIDINESEGLHRIEHDISEVEQCENRNQVEKLECLYRAITELFEIDNIEMQCTSDANSFFIINKYEGEIKHGINSPWLSRELLKKATPKELSGAIIDLLLHRDKWSKGVSYRECHLFG